VADRTHEYWERNRETELPSTVAAIAGHSSIHRANDDRSDSIGRAGVTAGGNVAMKGNQPVQD
jgi:hypothetical protein